MYCTSNQRIGTSHNAILIIAILIAPTPQPTASPVYPSIIYPTPPNAVIVVMLAIKRRVLLWFVTSTSFDEFSNISEIFGIKSVNCCQYFSFFSRYFPQSLNSGRTELI